MELYYVPESPPCRAVLLTIKALEVDICLRKLDMFQKAEHKRAWFLKLNPMHTVPTLDDNGYILWESRAIMTYLAQKYQKDEYLYPSDPQKRATVDRMLYFDIGTLYKSISDYWVFGKQTPDTQKANVLKQSLEYLDRFLEEGDGYVAGDRITVADFSLLSSVTALEAYGYDYSGYSNIRKWVNSLKNQLPYYEECVQTGVNSAKAFYQSLLKNNH